MESNTLNSASPEVLKQHFIHHLNRVYFGKKYVKEHLPNLINLSTFKKLKQAIEETWGDIKNQVERLENIYQLLQMEPARENCVPIIAVFKDAFEPQDYGTDNYLLNDIDIILYLQLLEHMNLTSYRMLKVLAAALNYTEAEQMLLESFDEATDNDKLFLMIADEYVKR
jgi:ferritin-like metal-binding protein YciE